MRRGYFAVWRKIEDHEFYKEKRVFSKYEAWLDILMQAQHDEDVKDVVIGMRVLKCNYGESLKSVRTWGTRWSWGEARVKRFLKLLEKMNQIRCKNETVTTRISILNYCQYDPKRHSYDTASKQLRNSCETLSTTDKNVKNEKNVKRKETKENFVFPDSFSEALVSKFKDFIENRRELKKPVTERAFKALVEKLTTLSSGNEAHAIQIINNSIESGWAGFFQLKTQGKQNGQSQKNFGAPGYYGKSSTDGKDNGVF